MRSAIDVPPDWYRSGFPPITSAMPWADRTEAEVDRAIMMLRPEVVGSGKPRRPKPNQFEIFVEGRK